MKLGRLARLALVISLGVTLASCAEIRNSPLGEAFANLLSGLPGMANTSGLQIKAVRSIHAVIVSKIAVMPLIEEPGVGGTVAPGASDSITADIYARGALMGGWELVSQDDVNGAMQQMAPTTLADMTQNAIALGKKVAADGVIYGTVTEYRERVGYSYAAQTPAAVAFTLHFLDERSGQVVWTAKFAKAQKALSANVLDLPRFISNEGRWVRAQDIAAEGAQEALNNLHSSLAIRPIVQGR
ncbi:MAG: hypothetical protein ACREQE_00480 [Candidatus Binataceae bacterium]